MQVDKQYWTLVIRHRRILIVCLHMGMIIASSYIAFWLRFDGAIPASEKYLWVTTLPWLVLIRGCTFIPLRLYEGLWRYTGIWDLQNIIGGVLLSSILFFLVVTWGFAGATYPRSIYVIDSLVLIFFMGGIRLLRRIHQGWSLGTPTKRLLIYGAGDAGELLARDITNNRSKYDCQLIGFVDDDTRKIGQRIHGVKVLGSRKDIAAIMKSTQPDEILIAITGITGGTLREIVGVLEPYKVPIKTLPSLSGQLKGTVTLSQVRVISFEDLLDRASVGLDLEPIRRLLCGTRILVTGAGGSIGSELCRQIARYNPESLVMLDKSESALYAIDIELAQKSPGLKKMAVLGDIKHVSTITELFSRLSPQIVFHAAAYKHVPMIEHYPEEAVLNNITGTYRLSQIAIDHGAERFVLISSDKAVNPTNVMGATKRAGEMYIQSLVQGGNSGKTLFSAVRFGNVLGSNGSVVPLFLQQIDQGGPVTVTHPEVTRYFMTIPEAVQLLLRAATLAQGGEIFVLEMGDQIKLVDMARNLIRICGYIPDKEIPITFIGLRPGEKLREELVGTDEFQEASAANRIFVVRSRRAIKLDCLTQKIQQLERAAINDQPGQVIQLLKEIVPEFQPT